VHNIVQIPADNVIEKILFSSFKPAIGTNRLLISIIYTIYCKINKFDFISNNSINPGTMTKFLKKDEITNSWYEIDAKNAVVGRLATIISKIIRGKNKTTYTPHMDHGDFVVVKNVEQAKFTGKKFQDKKYYRHTGHPGGIKETTPEKLHEKKPGETLKLAVKRMLPGGVLGRKQLTKLKIYVGENHPHTAQNLTSIDITKLNNKNLVRK
jgi:large subunit ribosomal protein L13